MKFLAVWVASVGMIWLYACASATPPAFGRDRVIELARKGAAQSRPEVGMEEARIDEVTADLMPLSKAYQQAGIDSMVYDDPPVWLVLVRGEFVYEGFSKPGFRDMYQSDTQFFIYEADTGRINSSGIKNSRLIRSILKPTEPPQTPHASRVEIEELARRRAEGFHPLHGGGLEKLESIHAELVRRGKAYRLLEITPTSQSPKLSESVWFVTVKGKFWFLSPPGFNEEGKLGQWETEGDELYWTYTLSGEEEDSGSNATLKRWILFAETPTP